MMTELSLFFILVIVGMAAFNMIMLKKRLNTLYGRIFELETRLNYQQVAMAYNNLIPMPWEIDDLEEHFEEVKKFTSKGNVIYLNNKEQNDED